MATYRDPILIYRQPQATYNGTIQSVSGPLSARARIAVANTSTLEAKARTSSTPTYIITAQGRLLKTTIEELQAKGWIVTGGPLEQTITAKSRIRVQPTKTFKSQARVSIPSCVRLYEDGFTYEAEGFTYNSPCAFWIRESLTAKAYIRPLHRLDVKANIATGIYLQKKTLSARGRIIPAFSAKARILKYQGWPIPETNDPGYLSFVPTQLVTRAKMTSSFALSENTMRIKGRITYGKTYSLTSRARIVSGQKLGMRANIEPRWRKTELPCTFNIQRVDQTELRVVFYINGLPWTRTMGMRACIQGKYSTRLVGHFFIPMAPATTSGVVSIEAPVATVRSGRSLSARGRIV